MEERICRVCLSTESVNKFTNIFENKLALKIFLVTSVKIIELQNVPALICKSCEIEAYQCINFRRKIQTSQEYFDNKLPCLETFIETYFEHVEGIENNNSIESNPKEEIIEEYLEFPDEENVVEQLVEESPKEVPVGCNENPIRRLSCRYCGLKLSRRQRLIQHERLHFLESANKYTCDKCGKNFNQRFGLVPHFQKHHGYRIDKFKETWKCAICENKILAPGNLEVHYHKFHKEFYESNTSQKPAQTSKNPTKNKPKKEPSKKLIRKELKKPKTFFPCEICGNSFTSSTRYHKHLNQIHGIKEQELDEKASNDQLESSSKHHRKHIPCSTCGKLFTSLNTCKTHEKIHSGLRYICDLCGSCFSMKPYLTSHVQKVHLKLKRFKCSMCNKSFIHRELLNYHIKKHLNIRNYSCQFCQKTFVRKACALIHERIHKNERPFSCKYCDRQFIHHSDHRRHELRHINDTSYRSFRTE
ncbi:zinc finger protein 883-like [Chironomus tepperi]|uniref:zinc finger protein 883-like n=1 Tax=Chironomus tepperi TaxID=113505 RepID=UPI00391F1664